MFFIMKYNQQLYAAARPTTLAVQRRDDVGATQSAAAMSATARVLADQAASKASSPLISGNDQVYASMARQALMVSEAGRLIASADLRNGTFDRAVYQRRAALLSSALSSRSSGLPKH